MSNDNTLNLKLKFDLTKNSVFDDVTRPHFFLFQRIFVLFGQILSDKMKMRLDGKLFEEYLIESKLNHFNFSFRKSKTT